MASLLVDFPSRPRPVCSGLESSCSQSACRKVAFGNTVQVNIVEDLSIKHKADLWFSKEETKFFKLKTALSLKQLKSASTTDANYSEKLAAQDSSTILGLESCMSQKSHREKITRRIALRKAICFEQERQHRIGICDPDILANISEVNSEWARRRARVIAVLHKDRDDAHQFGTVSVEASSIRRKEYSLAKLVIV